MSERVHLLKPNDLHVHVRQLEMLLAVLKYTAHQCAHALVMPNLRPPIRTAEEALRYKEEILEIAAKAGFHHFNVLMTLYLTGATTTKMVEEAAQAGVTAFKVYPQNGTTNSEHGITDILHPRLNEVLWAISEKGMKLCVHGEVADPDSDVMEREQLFLYTFGNLAMKFPDLSIVLEHISTKDAVEMIKFLPRIRKGKIAATITAHHLKLTLNDVIGSKITAAHHCMPVVKTKEDRAALWEAIRSENPLFFLGSDSAPHPKENKWCSEGNAGVFTAPILMPLLATMFEERFLPTDWKQRLENFATRFGAAFYGLLVDENERIELVREPLTIPLECEGIPMPLAGKILPWSLTD